MGQINRSAQRIAFTAAILVGGSIAAQDARTGRAGLSQRPKTPEEIPTPLVENKLVWPELRPGVAERGGADEPDIANMGTDWTHEMELRAAVDRTEFRQGERIEVACRATNVSGTNHIWLPPYNRRDRYLRARVRVFDVKGKLRPMTEFYKHEGRTRAWEPGAHSSGGGSLNPGETHRIEVVPNTIYDMTRPGEYWILVEMPLGSSFGRHAGGVFYLRAQPIKVKIVPEVIAFDK